MVIIVDGYNVLKQAKGIRASEAEKQTFIKMLARYAAQKQHDIILVFDGGYSLYPSKERHEGIIVIYAGIHQSADDYIKKLLDQGKNKEALLVSSDNELGLFAHHRNIPSIGALDFFKLVHEKKDKTGSLVAGNQLQKFSTASANRELEQLMEEETKNVPFKKEDEVQKRKREQQKSKHEKKLLKKVKKL